ncbi:hypothetical protein QQX98_010811 [Neonectria punicea]|uniref:Uncharacterized protein n=1 Tax=Neonectria punicea TaxID=979145 RepID=A0ABR1GNX9_9HYPO
MNRIDILELLFNAGADHDIGNTYQSTAIVLAAESDEANAVRVLLEHGASARASNSTASSALHRAAQNGYLECVTLLAEAGADLDAQKKNELTLFGANATATLSASPVSNLPEDAVLFALQHPAAFFLESPGETLQLIISSRQREAALTLIKSGIGINQTGGEYHTALQAAAATQSIDMIQELLEKQADPNIFGGVYGSVACACCLCMIL